MIVEARRDPEDDEEVFVVAAAIAGREAPAERHEIAAFASRHKAEWLRDFLLRELRPAGG